MNNQETGLKRARARAVVLSNGYRRQLDHLWWVNVMFVVFPAVGSAAAAIIAALPNQPKLAFLSMPWASALAGGSAVLLAIHKALKCDEYQAECLRLSQAYESLAIRSELAQDGAESVRETERVKIARRLAGLSLDAKAKLPARHRRWMEKRYDETGVAAI